MQNHKINYTVRTGICENKRHGKDWKRRRTELRGEEEDHNNGGDEGDDAARERAAVEILINLRVGVKAPQLADQPVHCYQLTTEENTQLPVPSSPNSSSNPTQPKID